MFVVISLVDVIRIPPALLGVHSNCIKAIESEIDIKYPNRVLLDHGLVICRYGNVRNVSNGVCVAGDGGSHHTVHFSLVVFRPFVEEVVLGRITQCTVEGVHVSLGFFDDIFIPAYWMLRPSTYERDLGVWVWTPQYDDDSDNGKNDSEDMNGMNDDDGDDNDDGGGNQIQSDPLHGNAKCNPKENAVVPEKDLVDHNRTLILNSNRDDDDDDDELAVPNHHHHHRFEMDIGAVIRFKVKSIQFTQVTKTAKGTQSTTTTTTSSSFSHASSSTATAPVSTAEAQQRQQQQQQQHPQQSSIIMRSSNSTTPETLLPMSMTGRLPLRRERSYTMDENPPVASLSSSSHPQQSQSLRQPQPQQQQQPPMYIIGTICEDGLGLLSWWTAPSDDDDDEDLEEVDAHVQ